MYATRTTFAATTAVMAAKVESPRMQRVRRGRVIRVDDLQRRTIPYVLLRCEIRSNRDDTERQTEDDELEKYSLAVNGPVKDVRNANAGLLLTHLQWSAQKSVQKHPVHSFFTKLVWVWVSWWWWTEGVGRAMPNEHGGKTAAPSRDLIQVMRSTLVLSEPASRSHLKARTRADYKYFLSYRTRWLVSTIMEPQIVQTI